MNFGNNKSTIFLVIILCLSFIYVYKNQPKYDSKLLKRLHLDNYKFTAHAGGGIDQYIYTNSKEAIYKSIKNGFKLIEIDLQETDDEIFIGVHDWHRFKKITNYNKKNFLSDDIKNLKIYGKYTLLLEDEINKIFINNKNIYFITDKTNNFKKLNHDFKLIRDRMIVEVFDKKSLKKAVRENIKNPIYNYKLGDYKYIIRNNIKIITANINEILKNKDEFKKLVDNNIFVFAYTSNEDKLINQYMGVLFTHVYTDFFNLKNKKCMAKKELCITY